jgi:WD40 repeat protein
MADVFISYKREDRRWAELVDARLRSAGFSTWWDTGLAAGDTFTEVIQRELAGAKVVAVIWSEAAWSSRWVQAEAADGHNRDVLVCARADNVAIGVPFNILEVADLRTPRGVDRIVEGALARLSSRPSIATKVDRKTQHTTRTYGRITGASLVTAGSCGICSGALRGTFSVDGGLVAATRPDGASAQIVDVRTGNVRSLIRGHGAGLLSPKIDFMTFSAHNDWLATRAGGAKIMLWDVATGALSAEITATDKIVDPRVGPPQFSPLAPLMLVGAGDGARVVAAPSGETMTTLEAGYYTGLSAWTPDGAVVLTTQDIGICAFNAATGKALSRMKIPALAGVSAIRVSPDGRRVAGFGIGKTIRIWGIAHGVCELEIDAHKTMLTSIAFNTDGSRLYSLSRDGDLKVLDSASGRVLKSHSVPQWTEFAIDHKCERLLLSGPKGYAAIVEAETGQTLYERGGKLGAWVAWSPDGLAFFVTLGESSRKYELYRVDEV